jgi:CheY-specific phosphatase CheX
MKHAIKKDSAEILYKIEVIEREVQDLKLSVLKNLSPSVRKIVSLKGIIKGKEITEKDIVDAKKALYGKVRI